MGIYDRDYYRDDEGGFLANWSRSAQMTKSIVVVTVAVFVVQMATLRPGGQPGAFTEWLELVGSKVMRGEVWRLLTYGFLHSTDILHIIFNMLIFWLVGRELEERHGPREFLAFYLVALVVSGLVFVGSTFLKLNQTDMDTPAVGASGAVTAALILFILHDPKRKILLFFVIPMPIWVLGVLFVGHDLLGMLSKPGEGDSGQRVAFAAHLGGAAFGALYFFSRARITGLVPGWPSRAAQRAQPRLRVRREEDDSEPELPEAPEPLPPPKADPDVDEHLEAQLDAVLAKVAKQGQGSLTSAERAVLHRASEVYRRRRR
jgi:membrane associated rhomboid family serine protease